MFLRRNHKTLPFVQSDILVMTQPVKKCLDPEQENTLKSPTLWKESALLNLMFMLLTSGEFVLAGYYRKDRNSLHLVNPLPKAPQHIWYWLRRNNSSCCKRVKYAFFIYNLNIFICDLVTKSTQPQFQQSHFSFRNTIKGYICTHWKTHISIQKHHTGSTQQLFPFSCFVGSYGNGSWSSVSPEQPQANKTEAEGTGSCHKSR